MAQAGEFRMVVKEAGSARTLCNDIEAHRTMGWSWAEIADIWGVSTVTLRDWRKRLKIDAEEKRDA